MPREQLLGLVADVDRLLAAGASAAVGNDGLSRRGRTLRELGQKVAALKPVADAVERVTSSSSREVGRAFLDLVVMARQLRGSLAGTGREGPLQVIESNDHWQTPMRTRDVYNIHDALTADASSPILHEAVECQVSGDLRLLPSALAALESNKSSIADPVADKVIPAIGRSLLPDLLAKLDLKGNNSDARRLRAICKIDPKIGAELCRKGVSEGSRPVRVQALECLPDVGQPDEAQRIGLEKCKDKEPSVRMAALRALRKATADEALEVLIQALLEDHWQIPQLAHNIVVELPHPKTTERLLRETEERVSTLPPLAKPKKGVKQKERQAAEEAEKARQLSIEHLGRLIKVVADRKDAGNSRVLSILLPLTKHEESDIREKTLLGLGKWGNEFEEVLPLLIESIEDSNQKVANAAIAALGQIPPAKREGLIPALIEQAQATKASADTIVNIVEMLPAHMRRCGNKILDLMRQLLKSKNDYVRRRAIIILGEIGPPAREFLPQILAEMKSHNDIGNYESIFANIEPEGTTSIPVLIELLKGRKAVVLCNALRGLEGYGQRARTAEDAVAKLTEDRDWFVKRQADRTLKAIVGGA